MRLAGVLCLVGGFALLVGLRFAGRSARSAAAWTPYGRVSAGFAGVVAIVAGVLLLTGGA